LTPRAMVIAVENWPTGARFTSELSKAGFEVAAVSGTPNIVRRIAHVRHYAYFSAFPLRSVARAIKHWSPQLLFCIDDGAVRALHRLHEKVVFGTTESDRRLRCLIEDSLGDPAHFATAAKKTRFIAFADALGLRCPATCIVETEQALQKKLASTAFPTVVKADGSAGGRGVRIARNAQRACAAYQEFQISLSLPRRARQLLGLLPAALGTRVAQRWAPAIAVQDYVEGRPANRAVACWKGEVLGGISAEAVEVASETGPCTEVRMIANAEMEASAAQLVSRLGLSSLCGFDFVIDAAGHAWLIEINARVTPICHLVHGKDLLGLLYTRMTGAQPHPKRQCASEEPIALFPGEWLRTSQSAYLGTGYHDVPWDQPSFVRACLDTQGSIATRIRARLGAVVRSRFRRSIEQAQQAEPAIPFEVGSEAVDRN